MAEGKIKWLALFPARSITRAFDITGTRRAWALAREGQQRVFGKGLGGLPLVRDEDGDGAVDLEATALKVRNYTKVQFSEGRCSDEILRIMGEIDASGVSALLAMHHKQTERRMATFGIAAVAAMVMAFICMVMVAQTGSAIGSAIFFVLFAIYLTLSCFAEAKILNGSPP